MNNKLDKIILKNKLFFKMLCLILTICSMITLFLSFINITLELIAILFYLLFIISIYPMVIISEETLLDYIVHFLIGIYSLIMSSYMFSGIINFLFKNEYITIYFAISSFFIFSYLYERSFSKINNSLYKQQTKAWQNSAAFVGYMCNIIRIIILVLTIFDTQYNLGLKNYPISEAIITSLAFEKIIKNQKNK